MVVRRVVCGEVLAQVVAIDEAALADLAAARIACPVCGLRHAVRIDTRGVEAAPTAKQWLDGRWQATERIPKLR